MKTEILRISTENHALLIYQVWVKLVYHSLVYQDLNIVTVRIGLKQTFCSMGFTIAALKRTASKNRPNIFTVNHS